MKSLLVYRVAAVLALLLLVGTAVSPSFTTYASPGTGHPTTLSAVGAGTWKTLKPSSHQSASSGITPKVYGGPGGSTCPSGSYSYSGSNAQYNCIDVTADGSGHGVWTRQGDGNYGYTHFFTPHNVWMSTVSAVIAAQAYGLYQSSTGRYLYGAYHVNSNGDVDQYINIYESRNAAPAPDGNEIGVITAYCQGPGRSFEQYCPDWVNTSWL